jgi:hypothetical protein
VGKANGSRECARWWRAHHWGIQQKQRWARREECAFAHPTSYPSLPGLTRQSIFFEKGFLRSLMDARIKSAHDES